MKTWNNLHYRWYRLFRKYFLVFFHSLCRISWFHDSCFDTVKTLFRKAKNYSDFQNFRCQIRPQCEIERENFLTELFILIYGLSEFTDERNEVQRITDDSDSRSIRISLYNRLIFVVLTHSIRIFCLIRIKWHQSAWIRITRGLLYEVYKFSKFIY